MSIHPRWLDRVDPVTPSRERLDEIAADPAFPRGGYAHRILYYGDEPGVLSGSEIRGSAKRWAWYHGQRERVMAVARRHGVHACYRRGDGAKVWTTADPAADALWEAAS